MSYRLAETTLNLVGRFHPSALWRWYNHRALRAGFRRLYLILSFDCDTPDDARVVLDLDLRLRDLGISPVYAVPGSLLESEERVYGALISRGAEFLNHGYVHHTVWNCGLGRYESTFFYDQLPLERVREDVENGHRALERVLGIKPSGFRVPHFGTFQEQKQLAFLHSVLIEMGYRYSSSSMPYYAFRYGPAFMRFGLLEFPVTGVYTRPMSTLDSYSFYTAPNRAWEPEDYLAQVKLLARFCREENLVGVLNYYADPSHIWDQPTFFKAARIWAEIAQPVGYRELVDECRSTSTL